MYKAPTKFIQKILEINDILKKFQTFNFQEIFDYFDKIKNFDFQIYKHH
jgi:hypothetical protein